MADMLVKLYNLPEAAPFVNLLKAQSIFIRRAQTGEKQVIVDWVRQQFSDSWAYGCEWSIMREPVSCYIAVEKEVNFRPEDNLYIQPKEKLIGFACYDASSKGMFGAMGVQEEYRERGIGRGLLLVSLHAMKAERYAYAVIGWAGPVKFYQKTVGATIIEGSEPGIFSGKLVSKG